MLRWCLYCTEAPSIEEKKSPGWHRGHDMSASKRRKGTSPQKSTATIAPAAVSPDSKALTPELGHLRPEPGDPVVWNRAAEMLAGRFKANLLADKQVCGALDKLEARVLRKSSVALPRTFRNEVLLWAAVAVQKPVGRAYWHKLFASGTGKSWKALTEFPKRIRRMAEELNKLLHHDYFADERAIDFSSLPSSLNDYADRIDSQIEELPIPRSHARLRYSQWALHLSRRVKALTGRVCDRQVADLLNAVNLVLNGEKDSKRDFDALTIAQARARFKKKKT